MNELRYAEARRLWPHLDVPRGDFEAFLAERGLLDTADAVIPAARDRRSGCGEGCWPAVRLVALQGFEPWFNG